MDHFEGKIQESIVYRIGICDDDEVFCEQMEGYLAVYARKTGNVIVTEIFLSGEAYLEFMENWRCRDSNFDRKRIVRHAIGGRMLSVWMPGWDCGRGGHDHRRQAVGAFAG